MAVPHNISTILASKISGEVYDDQVSRWLYSSDGSIFQQPPFCVAAPRNQADVMAVIKLAAEAGLSVHARGAGSGVCGSALGPGIVLDFTKFMNRRLEFNEHEPSIWCEPGFRLGELEVFLQRQGLFFPPDPSSGQYASLGGMFATNASGSHSVKYGNTADYILDAQVVFADGQAYLLSELASKNLTALPEPFRQLSQLYQNHRELIETAYPAIQCNTAGYNLRGLVQQERLNLIRLLAGSEGTLGITTRLKLRLAPRPRHDTLVVAFMPNTAASAAAVLEILPLQPSGIEIMDKSLLSLAAEHNPDLRQNLFTALGPTDIDNILLIEFDGDELELCRQSADMVRDLLIRKRYADSVWTAATYEEKQRFWAVRKAAVPTLFRLKGERKMPAIIEDAAVPVSALPAYFEGIYGIFQRLGLKFAVYGHIAKGLLHIRPLLNLKSSADINLLRPLAEAFFQLVKSLGGTVSGEHGDGRLRSAFLQRQYPQIYPLFLETKRILDPHHCFNPEIIINNDPDQMTKHLRFGTEYKARYDQTIYCRWNEGIIPEIEKCHGCSQCTTVTAAVRMCPVYKATRDEKASPRAKANLLRGIISGAIAADTNSLQNRLFAEVVSLCLYCGSCRAECPSGVNIPGLMAEAGAVLTAQRVPSFVDFIVLSYEYAARNLSALAPLARQLESSLQLRHIGEKIFKISKQGTLPVFAAQPLRRIIPRTIGKGKPSVVYFSGCHAGYARPSAGKAAVELLQQAGMTVYFPDQLCCGLPLMARGMMRAAKQKIAHNLSLWGDLLKTADYIATGCSSCAYMLTHQWNFLENFPAIKLIRHKTILISRLLMQTYQRQTAQIWDKNITYHLPCHLKLLPQPQSSAELLRLSGYIVHELPDSCCGMAGLWGMMRDHNTLSLNIGNKLMEHPALVDKSVLATDCPSCALQIERITGKQTMHPLEIIRTFCQ